VEAAVTGRPLGDETIDDNDECVKIHLGDLRYTEFLGRYSSVRSLLYFLTPNTCTQGLIKQSANRKLPNRLAGTAIMLFGRFTADTMEWKIVCCIPIAIARSIAVVDRW
jgi:hypothetical protein